MKQVQSYLARIIILGFITSCSGDGEPSGLGVDPPPNLTRPAEFGYNGYFGYIGYGSEENASFGMGVSFYTAAWKLVDQPLFWLQIGLPGTWILPNNSDNVSIPLCPEGTLARTWPERGPTWETVFQTLEGGLGYWRGNKFRYGPPKFSMNATPQCYDYEVASPGWSFFYDDQALEEEQLGIAQMSNRLLIPPDALTFEGDPNGEFMGYAYMALPLTDSYNNGIVDIGDQSWTCFINTANFKGPIAYYLPETWSKLSESYPAIEGKGLDAREGIINGGAMEINTVPHFEARDSSGTFYIKVPKLSFPAKSGSRAPLVQDLRYYNRNALYNDIQNWRTNDIPATGTFNISGMNIPSMFANEPFIELFDLTISELDNVFNTYVDDGVFGLSWAGSLFETGTFPEYYRRVGNGMIPVLESDVPAETQLVEAEFPRQDNGGSYTSPLTGSWTKPGPSAGPFTTTLNDGSTVTYAWYRFIDQPVFGQFNWSEEKRSALQSLIEKMHREWPIDRTYIPEPTIGILISLDENLIVTPPSGFEVGYVPIVIEQRY